MNDSMKFSLDWKSAILPSFLKINPMHQTKTPVMFVVMLCSVIVTFNLLNALIYGSHLPMWFVANIVVWLWLTLVFANFSESLAENQGKAQADFLKKTKTQTIAKLLSDQTNKKSYKAVPSSQLKKGDIVFLQPGDIIPLDGEVVEGIAAVDESAVTGESAPVIRESNSDRNSVTGGTKVLSDWIVIRISCNHGDSFLDNLIKLVEGSSRQITPSESALNILINSLTVVFVLVCVSLIPFSKYIVAASGKGAVVSIIEIVALFVCLIPTTIGALLPAIGISGINRLVQANVIAKSGKAVEAAGDVNIVLLDKTGTITYGNRSASEIFPAPGIDASELAKFAMLSSMADSTPEGKSILSYVATKYNIAKEQFEAEKLQLIPFSAETRMSGVVFQERKILKGAKDAIEKALKAFDKKLPKQVLEKTSAIANKGGTPLLVIDEDRILGVIYLKDIVKPGIKTRLFALRNVGIKSYMITGDNPLTAAAISDEAGLDGFIAEATPDMKLKFIHEAQREGNMVAMIGDGTNDAPALASADVALAMNNGTQAAKEAGNMIDLDSDPTKLIEIIEIGKQLLITRGSLTTFSISNDIAKYFALLPAMFATTYPQLKFMDVMHLSSPLSAIVSAVIFNAIIILLLIPIALKGSKYRPVGAYYTLSRNLLIYGVGGIVTPFIGIKIIDTILNFAGLV